MRVVRAFPARVVREDFAPRVVTPLSTTAESAADPVGPAIDPAAYEDSAAGLYVYRQQDGTPHTGVVCEVAVQAFADGRVRGHEAVDPLRVEALVRHQATGSGPPALVTLLHRESDAFTRIVDETTRGEPILDFASRDGLQQTVWRIADGRIAERLADELSTAEHHIADGHHRVAAALEQWRLAGKPADAGVLCVVHAMHDLRLSAFHRRATGPLDPYGLIGLLAAGFEVSEVPDPPTPRLGAFGVYVGRRWFDVSYTGPRDHGAAGLDVAVLETQVLQRLEHVASGTSYDVEIVASRTPLSELAERCDADGGALFRLAPPPLEALTSLADAGEVMPPKTTSFEPKPSAGIFLRPAS